MNRKEKGDTETRDKGKARLEKEKMNKKGGKKKEMTNRKGMGIGKQSVLSKTSKSGDGCGGSGKQDEL